MSPRSIDPKLSLLRFAAPRPRLAGLLPAPVAGVVVWLKGGPGTGKSTALALQSPADGTVWVDCIRDQAALLDLVDMAVSQVEAGVARVLVLDGAPAHDLPAGVAERLIRILEHAALWVAARGAPGGAWFGVLARAELRALDARALAFTHDEAAPLLPDRPLELRALLEASAGWPSGVVLGARLLREGGISTAAEAEAAVHAYFEREVLAGLETPTRLALLPTALLGTSDEALLRQWGGGLEAHRACAAAGWLANHESGGAQGFALHPLLRRVLLHWLAGQPTLQSLQLDALAEALAALGRLEAAFSLCCEAGTTDLAARYLARHAGSVTAALGSERLAELAWRLPLSVLAEDVDLLLCLAEATLFRDDARAIDYAERAWLAAQRGGRLEACARAAGLAVIAYSTGYTTMAGFFAWMERLDGVFEGALGVLSAQHRRQLQAATVLASTDAPSHVACCRQAAAMADALYCAEDGSVPNEPRVIELLACLCEAIYERGDPARIEALSHRVRASGLLAAVRPGLRFEWLYYESDGLRMHGRRESADQCVSELMVCAGECGPGARRLAALYRRGTLALDAGDVVAARADALAAIAAARAENSRIVPWLHKLAARCALQQQRYAEAELSARKALELALAMELPAGFDEILGAELFFALVGRREWRQAAARARAAAERCEGRLGEIWQIYALMCESRTAAQGGQAQLAEALGRARVLDWPAFFASNPAVAAQLCATALEREIEREFVTALIRQRRLVPPPETGPEWPWRVRIQLFDGFAVIIDGVPVDFGRKVPRRALELLKVLAVARQMECECQALQDVFWPAESGARKSMEMTVSRVRKLLGDDTLIRLAAGRVALDRARVFCDLAWSCARLPDLMHQVAHGGEAALDAVIHALLHHDPRRLDAPEDDPAPVRAVCAQYRDRWAGLAVEAAEALIGRGRANQALRFLESAIAIEPGAEAPYGALMRYHLALGQGNEAMVVFRRCRQMLSLLLGMEPSTALLRLRDRAREITPPAGPAGDT